MPARMTSVIGRISVNAARPTIGIISISISSVPYAAEEMPSEESTPSASGRDSRCSEICSLTSGGPSSLRLSVYPNVSGSLPSGGADALQVVRHAAVSHPGSLRRH